VVKGSRRPPALATLTGNRDIVKVIPLDCEDTLDTER
jgi:hypothetical protein